MACFSAAKRNVLAEYSFVPDHFRCTLLPLSQNFVGELQMKIVRHQVLAVLCLPILVFACSILSSAEGQTRTYYVAVDEVDWDYTPLGIDGMTGKPFDHMSAMYVESGKHQIGRVYRKAVYREYTDATFTTLKRRTAEWEHLGLLGPCLPAEVGDTIKILFKNNGTESYSMHPHGVLYEKASEGSYYNDGANDPTHNGVIAPGGTHTYI